MSERGPILSYASPMLKRRRSWVCWIAVVVSLGFIAVTFDMRHEGLRDDPFFIAGILNVVAGGYHLFARDWRGVAVSFVFAALMFVAMLLMPRLL